MTTKIDKWHTLREPTADDNNYIMKTMRMFFMPNHMASKSAANYWTNKKLAHMLSSSWILIASLPEEPMVIHGFIVASPPMVHFCYVKPAYRRMGLGSFLFSTVDQPIITHLSADALAIHRAHPMTYIPWEMTLLPHE